MQFRWALIVALALGASGCGAEAVPPEDVAAATEAAGTARIESVTRVDSPAVYEYRVSTVVDYVNDRIEYVVHPSGCRTIVFGDVSYTELPPDPGLPTGKQWVRYDGDDRSSEDAFEESLEPTTGDGVIFLTMDVGDSVPYAASEDYLDQLREISDAVQVVGHEDVRGTATIHYAATIDTLTRTRHELEQEGWKPANVERYLDLQQPATEKSDIWVDADGRVQKIVTTWEPSDGQGFRMVTTTDYLDFGLDVDIEPPAAATVLGEDDWRAITDAKMRKEMDEWEEGLAQESVPLPGGFQPAEPVAPPSCLH